MAKKSPQFLQKPKSPVTWDWWKESPVEIILLVFIVTLFVVTPWSGCGITELDIEPGEITVVP